MLLTANWRSEIRELWGIRVLHESGPPIKEVLWVTRCSKIKSDGQRGTPKELYGSPVNRYFYKCMEKQILRYGVLSDKYGLHLDDEVLPYYDIHPSNLSQQDKEQMGQLIRNKALARGFTRIVFYSPSPLMSVPYFQMLHHSGLDVFYTTRIDFSQGSIQ